MLGVRSEESKKGKGWATRPPIVKEFQSETKSRKRGGPPVLRHPSKPKGRGTRRFRGYESALSENFVIAFLCESCSVGYAAIFTNFVWEENVCGITVCMFKRDLYSIAFLMGLG